MEFRVTEGGLEIQDTSGAWVVATYEQGDAIFFEIERRLQMGFEELRWEEGRLKLVWVGEDEDEEEPLPDPVVAAERKTWRERILGKPYAIDPEVYVPGEGFANVSVLEARGHTQPTLEPKVARGAINAVAAAAKAESNVRRFAGVWEDLTVLGVPLPALDPFISSIPVVGEVVDGTIPMGVFWYNGLKAGLGVKALAKGTALQAGNLVLHVLKYGGPTVAIKFIVDWYFNSVTATTHDFTARRHAAIEVARSFGITEEDIEAAAGESIRRSERTEAKTENSRRFKRWTIEIATALASGQLGISRSTFEKGFPHIEKVLDFFYPLREDRERTEGSFAQIAVRIAHEWGNQTHKDHAKNKNGHGDAHGHGDNHGHGDTHGHDEAHGHADHAEDHGHDSHEHEDAHEAPKGGEHH